MHTHPFLPLMPTASFVEEFASLPYDVFDRAEAAAYVKDHPRSFLAIDRPETGFESTHDMYAPEVYAHARSLIEEHVAAGRLTLAAAPAYYLYELTWHGHTQTGVVAATDLADYDQNIIKKHELTRADKEQDRINHITTTGCQTGPIFLAFKDSAAVADAIATAQAQDPIYDFTDEEGVRQRVWAVLVPKQVAQMQEALNALPAAYIADGHHRAASAAKVSARLVEEAAGADEKTAAADIPGTKLLTVYFPASELTILPYNRLVHDSNGLTAEELLAALKAAGYSATKVDAAVAPEAKGTVGLYIDGSWYELHDTVTAGKDQSPVEALDVSRLQERVLTPILGIEDVRTSSRISFVGGRVSVDELAKRVDKRAAQDADAHPLAFSMFSTGVDELIAVADAGLLMPPKSTWFEPKLRSGLFLRAVRAHDLA